MSISRSLPSGVGGGATDMLRTRPSVRCGLGGVDVDRGHGEAAGDHVVHRVGEARDAVVVDLGQVEVHPAGAVAVDLGARDERAGELGEHERVEHVAGGVQRGDAEPVVGVDAHLHVTGRRRVGVGEDVPPRVAVDLDAGDRRRAAGPLDRADVARPGRRRPDGTPSARARPRRAATSTTVASWTYRSGCS